LPLSGYFPFLSFSLISSEKSRINITPLDAGELRDAIEKPAELIGLKFEDGLVDALIKDALGEPAALPLLQFTLLKLWESRDHNRLTWAAYQKLGGGRKALAYCADEFYESLIPQQKETAKRILLGMLQIKEGVEVTSLRIPRQNLYKSGEARDQIDIVLDKLIQARLVRLTEGDSPHEAQVEVAHEALIRNWERLRDWLSDERVQQRQRIHFREIAEQWQNHNQDKNLLLRGSFLEEAQTYAELNSLEQKFIRSSRRSERKKSEAQIFFAALFFVILSILSGVASCKWIQAEQKNELTVVNKRLTEQKRDLEGYRDKLMEDRRQIKAIVSGSDEKLALQQLRQLLVLPRKSRPAKIIGPNNYLRNVRTAPGTENPVLCTLNGNIQVEILDTKPDSGKYPWYQIKATGECKNNSWIAAHLVETINNN
jgi:hypothetical protein